MTNKIGLSWLLSKASGHVWVLKRHCGWNERSADAERTGRRSSARPRPHGGCAPDARPAPFPSVEATRPEPPLLLGRAVVTNGAAGCKPLRVLSWGEGAQATSVLMGSRCSRSGAGTEGLSPSAPARSRVLCRWTCGRGTPLTHTRSSNLSPFLVFTALVPSLLTNSWPPKDTSSRKGRNRVCFVLLWPGAQPSARQTIGLKKD